MPRRIALIYFIISTANNFFTAADLSEMNGQSGTNSLTTKFRQYALGSTPGLSLGALGLASNPFSGLSALPGLMSGGLGTIPGLPGIASGLTGLPGNVPSLTRLQGSGVGLPGQPFRDQATAV
ncbi:unnamed protein product [Gongylonema pulchrum]|uniref:Tropoelastin n=1 Tax=Gongylonema pulchrum TaxID=637853 RepID=A0A183DPA3_9BILA|nr:unnamed protein product [Gongylonema pulchrum]